MELISQRLESPSGVQREFAKERFPLPKRQMQAFESTCGRRARFIRKVCDRNFNGSPQKRNSPGVGVESAFFAQPRLELSRFRPNSSSEDAIITAGCPMERKTTGDSAVVYQSWIVPSEHGSEKQTQIANQEPFTEPLPKSEELFSQVELLTNDPSDFQQDLLLEMFNTCSPLTSSIADLESMWPELADSDRLRADQTSSKQVHSPRTHYLDTHSREYFHDFPALPNHQVMCSATCPLFLQGAMPQSTSDFSNFSLTESILVPPYQPLEGLSFLNTVSDSNQNSTSHAYIHSDDCQDIGRTTLENSGRIECASESIASHQAASNGQYLPQNFQSDYPHTSFGLDILEPSYYTPMSSSATSRSSSLWSLTSDFTASSSGYDSGIQCSPISTCAGFESINLKDNAVFTELPDPCAVVYAAVPNAHIINSNNLDTPGRTCSLCPRGYCNFPVPTAEHTDGNLFPQQTPLSYDLLPEICPDSSALRRSVDRKGHSSRAAVCQTENVSIQSLKSPSQSSADATVLQRHNPGGRRGQQKVIDSTSRSTSPPLQHLHISLEPEISDAHVANPRNERDRLLLTLRDQGISYKEIKARLNCSEAESTLRGRYRSLKKPKSQRLRKPIWTQTDIDLLVKCVTHSILQPRRSSVSCLRGTRPERGPTGYKPQGAKWKCISEEIVKQGGSYLFGPGTCKKKYDGLVEEGIAPPVEELEKRRQLQKQIAINSASGQEGCPQNNGEKEKEMVHIVKQGKVVKRRGLKRTNQAAIPK